MEAIDPRLRCRSLSLTDNDSKSIDKPAESL